MNFRKKIGSDDPELNFIPLIDVLLVVIIFLAVSTTFDSFSELQVNLPVAEAAVQKHKNNPLVIRITEDRRYSINDKIVHVNSPTDLEVFLKNIYDRDKKTTSLIINADGRVDYQTIISVMKASQNSGFTKIKFSTKKN
mgnify:CR=1 FL=1